MCAVSISRSPVLHPGGGRPRKSVSEGEAIAAVSKGDVIAVSEGGAMAVSEGEVGHCSVREGAMAVS